MPWVTALSALGRLRVTTPAVPRRSNRMSSSGDAMSRDAIYVPGGQTPACSSRAIAWSENSACGASPPMTNIRIDSWFGSPLVTFSKRRIMPGGNDTTSSGPRSTYSTLPFSSSQLARQVPVMGMNVSLVS